MLFDFGLRKFDPRLGSRIVPWVFLGYFGGIKTDFKIFEVKKLFFETLCALKHALEWRFYTKWPQPANIDKNCQKIANFVNFSM